MISCGPIFCMHMQKLAIFLLLFQNLMSQSQLFSLTSFSYKGIEFSQFDDTLGDVWPYIDCTSESESECKCLTCNQKPTGSQFSLLHEPN